MAHRETLSRHAVITRVWAFVPVFLDNGSAYAFPTFILRSNSCVHAVAVGIHTVLGLIVLMLNGS